MNSMATIQLIQALRSEVEVQESALEGNGNDGAERAKKRIRILEAEIERAYEQFGTGEH